MGCAELKPSLKGFGGVWETDRPLCQAVLSGKCKRTYRIWGQVDAGSNCSQATYQVSPFTSLSLMNGVIVKMGRAWN